MNENQFEQRRIEVINALAAEGQIIEGKLNGARATLADLRSEERSNPHLSGSRKSAIATQKLSLEAVIAAATGELQNHSQREAAARLGHIPELQAARFQLDAAAANARAQTHRDAEAAFDEALTPALMEAADGLRALGAGVLRLKVLTAFGL